MPKKWEELRDKAHKVRICVNCNVQQRKGSVNKKCWYCNQDVDVYCGADLCKHGQIKEVCNACKE